mmetsp:Transcript_27875/g.83301  ORF Transcript_27875/g.83301 Transcript_27875/m.83301 type:complete len:460 (-) Transcript_27875:367-1746(-)
MAYVAGAGAGRKQVPLKKGFGLSSWIDRTAKEGNKLAGPRACKREAITLEELAEHCSEEDMWMALQGRVYNITPYVPYHPGGAAELMRAAGGDGTQLFHEIHPWINIQRFLGKCYIGPLASGSAGSSLLVPGQAPRGSPLARSAKSGGAASAMPPPAKRGTKLPGPWPAKGATAVPTAPKLALPRKSFYQTESTAVVVLYGLDFEGAGLFDAVADRVAVQVDGTAAHVTVATSAGQYRVRVGLGGAVSGDVAVEHNEAEGKILIKLSKPETERQHWPTVASVESESYDPLPKRKSASCTLIAVHKLTHNTSVYSFLPPDTDGSWQCRLGQHLQVRVPEGRGGAGSAVRSYTPVSAAGGGGFLGALHQQMPAGGFQLLVKRCVQLGSPKQRYWRTPVALTGWAHRSVASLPTVGTRTGLCRPTSPRFSLAANSCAHNPWARADQHSTALLQLEWLQPGLA